MKKKTYFVVFQILAQFKAHALQSELNKVGICNFVYFRLHGMSFKIERAFEKITKFTIKIGPKRTKKATKWTINQCKIPYMRKNTFFFVIMHCYIL